jgi:hypothetical protein
MPKISERSTAVRLKNNNAEVVATMTVSEICQAVADDKSKLAEEIESNCTSKED